MSDVAWSDPLVSELRELWRAGKSASECASAIADKFSVSVSRCAVIGKVHRLGLSGRERSTSSRAPRMLRRRAAGAAAAREKIKRPVMSSNRIDIVETIDVSLPAELPSADIPVEQRKTLIELTSQTCRWPYGDPGTADFFYCGAPEADFPARPYCLFHAAVARGVRARVA